MAKFKLTLNKTYEVNSEDWGEGEDNLLTQMLEKNGAEPDSKDSDELADALREALAEDLDCVIGDLDISENDFLIEPLS